MKTPAFITVALLAIHCGAAFAQEDDPFGNYDEIRKKPIHETFCVSKDTSLPAGKERFLILSGRVRNLYTLEDGKFALIDTSDVQKISGKVSSIITDTIIEVEKYEDGFRKFYVVFDSPVKIGETDDISVRAVKVSPQLINGKRLPTYSVWHRPEPIPDTKETRDAFLASLKRGENFVVGEYENRKCTTCSGKGYIKKEDLSDLLGKKTPCLICSGKGAYEKPVITCMFWDKNPLTKSKPEK